MTGGSRVADYVEKFKVGAKDACGIDTLDQLMNSPEDGDGRHWKKKRLEFSAENCNLNLMFFLTFDFVIGILCPLVFYVPTVNAVCKWEESRICFSVFRHAFLNFIFFFIISRFERIVFFTEPPIACWELFGVVGFSLSKSAAFHLIINATSVSFFLKREMPLVVRTRDGVVHVIFVARGKCKGYCTHVDERRTRLLTSC